MFRLSSTHIKYETNPPDRLGGVHGHTERYIDTQRDRHRYTQTTTHTHIKSQTDTDRHTHRHTQLCTRLINVVPDG